MKQREGLDRILECDSIWKSGRLEGPEKKTEQVWSGTGEENKKSKVPWTSREESISGWGVNHVKAGGRSSERRAETSLLVWQR